MSECLCQIALSKGRQRFVFRYAPGEEERVVEAFRSLASRPNSGFDLFDATVLCLKLARRLERKTIRSARSRRSRAAVKVRRAG